MVDAAREIENLLYRYAERIDAGDFEGVADLFAHGRIHGVENGPPDTVFEGRERVLRMYEQSTRRYEDGTPKTKHVITNARIEVDDAGEHATAHSSYTVMQATPDLPLQPIITGRYHDSFHLVDGRWAFDTRVMHVDHLGNLSHHLLFSLRP